MDKVHWGMPGGVYFRKSQSFLKLALKKRDLTFNEGIILINVCENDKINQEQIANNLALDRSVVTRGLKLLEKKNLVTRKIVDNNERMKLVSATSQGKKMNEQISRFVAEWNKLFFEPFSPEQTEVIKETLILLRDRSLDIDLDKISLEISDIEE